MAVSSLPVPGAAPLGSKDKSGMFYVVKVAEKKEIRWWTSVSESKLYDPGRRASQPRKRLRRTRGLTVGKSFISRLYFEHVLAHSDFVNCAVLTCRRANN